MRRCRRPKRDERLLVGWEYYRRKKTQSSMSSSPLVRGDNPTKERPLSRTATREAPSNQQPLNPGREHGSLQEEVGNVSIADEFFVRGNFLASSGHTTPVNARPDQGSWKSCAFFVFRLRTVTGHRPGTDTYPSKDASSSMGPPLNVHTSLVVSPMLPELRRPLPQRGTALS